MENKQLMKFIFDLMIAVENIELTDYWKSRLKEDYDLEDIDGRKWQITSINITETIDICSDNGEEIHDVPLDYFEWGET